MTNFTKDTWNTIDITIPENFRPYDIVIFPIVAMANNVIQGYGKLKISNDGTISYILNITGTITDISFDGVYFSK